MALDPSRIALAFFGAELRRLRENAELTQSALAKRTQYALATVSAYETGKRIPSPEFAVAADKIFGTDGHLARLQALADSLSVLPWLCTRTELERNAVEIREYDSYQIPGLLTTENYARAVISAARPMLTNDAVERALALRMTRQQILEANPDLPIDISPTPRLWAIIDESALNRIVGSPEVMREQREHLIDLAHLPNVTIQIIAESEGVTCAYGKAFTILISSGNGSPVVYLEDIRNARYVRDRDEVAQYALTFDHLRSCALNDSRSLEVIKG